MAKVPSSPKRTPAKKTTASKTSKTPMKKTAAASTPAATPPKNPALAGMSTTGVLRPDTPDAAMPKPVLVTDAAPNVALAPLQKKELLEAVVTRSGIKKKDAKPVVEAMMAVMGEALGEGRELELQPFGKFKINRIKDTGNGKVIIGRVRQSLGGKRRGNVIDDSDD